MPGSLPVLNRAVTEYAARAGLALGGAIQNRSIMSRKHYVYPDLPKAYQVSQYDLPLCVGGGITLSNGRRIDLTRIHIEEDAGKLVHVGREVLIDYNRGGVPLIEIVTEPDFRSADEVTEYMERLQTALRAIGVSDCRMQEGSMRCDVNISLRQVGAEKYGIRAEVKNLNSFTSVAAAIAYEFERQAEILEAGGTVVQETRSFDADTGITAPLRDKENADDYRYFPEPDIVPVLLTDELIDALRVALPEMPDAKLARYVAELGVAEADAKLLTKYSAVSRYFEAASEGVSPRTVASFMVSTMFAQVTTEAEREKWNPSVTAAMLRELIELIESGKVSRNVAKRVYSQMAEEGRAATAFLSAEDMEQFDDAKLTELCRAAVEGNPKSVADYLKGKDKALKAIVGAVMRETKGRADALETERIIKDIISESSVESV
jgi:aspartyl-tRNA(Asn)/glutamyl-tRNA(Gln) amidotransferase subunit B